MSYANLAIPGQALQRGFRGCSTRLGDFIPLGDFAIGTLSEGKGLFTWHAHEAFATLQGAVNTSPLTLDEPILEGAMVQFEPDSEEEMACPAGPNQFIALLSTLTPSPNYCYAIRISGLFSSIRLTSLPGAVAAWDLPGTMIHRREGLRGILMGFYFPSFLENVAWAGYRFHFLSDDHSIGGRLVDCEIEQLQVALRHVDECRLSVPKTADFQLADF